MAFLPITAAKADDACSSRSRTRRHRSDCQHLSAHRPPSFPSGYTANIGQEPAPWEHRHASSSSVLQRVAVLVARSAPGRKRPFRDAGLNEPMPLSRRSFEADVMARLQRGEHIVLYGPRGSGKSALLAGLHARFARTGIPCGLSTATAHLDDITRAFALAYPNVVTASLPRRKARARLRMTADANEGVLLLDHVTEVSTAMIGFLRRLRGGIAGVLLTVDVEKKRDEQRLRHRHLGTSTLPMPAASPRQLRKLFRACCTEHRIMPVHPGEERAIIRAARGRPGWIVQCARLLRQKRYWRHTTLLVSVLCLDTEIVLRQGLFEPLTLKRMWPEPPDDREDVV